jgi:hypothetical protein
VIVVRWFSMCVFWFCFLVTLIQFRVDGTTVIGAISLLVVLWSFGWLRREAWISDDPAIAEIDRSLDREGQS